MEKLVKIATILSVFLGMTNALAESPIVYDPTNWAENSVTAANTIKSYEELVTSNESLKFLTDSLKGFEAAELKKILSLIEETVNENTGNSQHSQLSKLKSKDKDYIQKRDQLLQSYFAAPLQDNEIQMALQGGGNQEDIDAFKNYVKSDKRSYDAVIDAVDETSNSNEVAKNRADKISLFNQTIQNLGPKSELKTQQTIAALLALQAEQNEQLIQQQKEALHFTKLKQAAIENGKIADHKLELEQIKKSIHLGTSGLGRSKWGDS